MTCSTSIGRPPNAVPLGDVDNCCYAPPIEGALVATRQTEGAPVSEHVAIGEQVGQSAPVKQTPAEAAAADLRTVIGSVKRGSLRVFGDWFGRPHDNIHIVRSALAEGNELVVGFDANETLRVTSPADWEFSENSFRVHRARRVLWTWFYYGHDQTPENLFTVEHWIDDHGEIHASSDVNWYKPTFEPSVANAAVELL